ncbi:alpha/beta fold hydrolase [candidate division KSB1 bacterium]|nr:alpha/beta fold hydrolase [candidate division KSB1 bacterium]
MSSIPINGKELKYNEQGKGEPLVLVHGSASDYRTWHHQEQVFNKQYRVISYSRRYHWPNEKIPEKADYAMQEHVEDLKAMIRDLDVAPTHLVGHSYGAFLCMLLAMQEPELVRTLVLAEPPVITLFVSNTPKPGELVKLLFTRPRTATAIIRFGVNGLAPARAAAKRDELRKAMHLFGKAILGKKTFERLSDQRLEQIEANAFKAEFLGSGFVPLDQDKISSVNIPTLLISAQNSHPLFHRLMDRLEELLPRRERIEIRDASHIMHEDNPGDFNSAVLQFLNAKSPGS